MQATVNRFSTDTRSGSVLLDSGAELAFGAAAFDRSGLLMLRPGQRVKLRVDDAGTVTSIQILTLPDPD